MSSVASVNPGRSNEVVQKKQAEDLKKIEREHQAEFTKTVDRNEKDIKRLQNFYSENILTMKNELETKHNEMRIRHKERLEMEHGRLNEELSDIKKAHEDMRAEIKTGQEKEIAKLRESHTNYLENARRNFEKHTAKYKT